MKDKKFLETLSVEKELCLMELLKYLECCAQLFNHLPCHSHSQYPEDHTSFI